MFKSVYTTQMSGKGKTLEKRFNKITEKPIRFKNLAAMICAVVILSVFTLGTIAVADIDNEAEYNLDITNNGEVIELENKPFVENGEVYVPLRELFTKLGFMSHTDAKMEWDNGVVLIYLVEKNQNEDAASTHTSYGYKIEIGKNELVTNPDELVSMQGNYEFVESMNFAPVLKGNITYIPFAYAQKMVERADNGIQSLPYRYELEFIYSGEVLEIGYPFDKEYKVTSAFGERIHPVTGEKKLHSGMDFGAPLGTAVKAGIDGMVTDEGFDENYGNYVVVKNDLGVEILYAHLNTIARRGAYEVKKGDIIGYSGNSGKSAGAHLHIEVKINGRYVNPENYMMLEEMELLNIAMPQIESNLSFLGYPDADYRIVDCQVGEGGNVKIELTNYDNTVLNFSYYKMSFGWKLWGIYENSELRVIFD